MRGEGFTDGEWRREEWMEEWSINMGNAFVCNECGAVVMVTRGGIGMLEPRCCDRAMAPLKTAAGGGDGGNA
ncbi:MAG TPA: hypothetical protein ENJ37_02675 [Deltaproteobacteria bacterium]|nr:hypothetical protein [Deltaproteobacteria bacterium]